MTHTSDRLGRSQVIGALLVFVLNAGAIFALIASTMILTPWLVSTGHPRLAFLSALFDVFGIMGVGVLDLGVLAVTAKIPD